MCFSINDFFHYEEAVIGCCGCAAAGVCGCGGDVGTTSDCAPPAPVGLLAPCSIAVGDSGEAPNADGPALWLAGATGPPIVDVVSWVRGSELLAGTEDPGPDPAGTVAGGGAIGALLLVTLLQLLLLAMIEFKCIDDFKASEFSLSAAAALFCSALASISIVVNGPVPREHWNSTREMMSATCWSSM